MVTNVTSLTRNGLRDWIIQRVSAVVLGIYAVFLFLYVALHPELSFTDWHNLFSDIWMQIFSFLALLSLVLHSWVGIWTVLTDYIKPYCVRLFLQVLLVLALFAYLAWGAKILWGN